MKIPKGEKYGLPCFLERDSYFHYEKQKYIQVNYTEFCETPTGERVFVEPKGITIEDPEKYAAYCTKFGAEAIGAEIDKHLKTL